MPRISAIAIVAVSVLAPLALFATDASAQSVLQPFDPATIQRPKTMNQPTYAPTYAPTYSNPSVGSGPGQKCEDEELPKAAGNLSGLWSVGYPGGPLRVCVVHRGTSLVATLIDGNIAIPAGKVTVQANAADSRTFMAEQICALPGYRAAHFVDVRFTVAENGKSMREDLIGFCGGGPVAWNKIK